MKNVVIGIEINGATASFGLVDDCGNCYASGGIQTKLNEGAESLFNRLFAKINKTLKDADGQYEIAGIGVGAPCANYYSGTIENSSNLNWSFVNVVELIKGYYDLPIAITNDANAAAIGEMKFGIAKNLRNFIQIILGYGLGSGIVADGNIFYGYNGFAGEIGHMTVVKNGRMCGCGRKGCLETYVSTSGIIRTYYELISSLNEDSLLKEFSPAEMSSDLIQKAALNGDRIALAAYEYTGRILGEALANIVACFSPEAIVLSEDLAAAGDLLIKPTREHMENNLLNLFKGKVQILQSALANGDVAILGASALIWHDLQKSAKLKAAQ